MRRPPADTPELRWAVIETARRMARQGLTRNTSGNLSHRVVGGLVVTPSGMDYDGLQPDDLVFLDMNGRAVGKRLPSSEWRFHRDILMVRDEVDVVLHAHSPFATSLACLRLDIPAFHYMVAVFGGANLRCATYATFGTEELSRNAVLALDGRKGCLLANHGMIVIGQGLEQAFKLAVELETLAEMYFRACQLGEPFVLDDNEMAVVLEKFRTYGRQPGEASG